MKKKTLALALSTIFIAAIFSGLALVSAPTQSVIYKGTLDTWYEYWNWNTKEWQRSDAKIVESQWRIYRSWDGTVVFHTSFTELNVSEEPLYPGEGEPGTYDDIIFRIRTRTVTYTDDGIEISGECVFWKNGAYVDSFKAYVTVNVKNYATQMTFTDNSTNIYGSLIP
ncbi:hypothetical protein KEJ21_04600 [Candidatus Bathyarchaeota archaeon]|nr:hypothetical protein [Candidatus Bathyarchaeota archaeon]